MNTTEFLEISSAICPDRPSIVFEKERVSYAELKDRANRLANGLAKLGVKTGDRVGLLQVNTNQCVEAYFAVAKLGAIFVPLNFRAKANELTYMLNTADALVVLVGDRYLDMVDGMRPDLKTVKHFISLDKKRDGYLFYGDILASSSPDDVFTDIADEDTTILMYTAGTTGFPKGVMLSHNSFSIYVMDNVTPADPDIEEKNILTVPLYHVAGIQAMMAAIYGGRTLIMERQFDPREWMELVEKEKVNRAMMVPTMLKQLMDNPEFSKHDLSSLKVITYGAAPMPLEVIKKALDIFPNTRFINAFGQTETASTITMLSPEDHVITGTPEEKERKLKRLSSIGKPMADVEMRVVNEDGVEVAPNEVGEIVARGPRAMSGYWKDPDKTAKTIKDGWIYTGDMGYKDDEGYFFLAGRATDMIIRAGENISPEEVEAVIQSHPKVDDVAVIGIPDLDWGEKVMAVVVPRKGEKLTREEITEWSRQRLASYKKAELVEFIDELPRNPMGKILKRVLRDQFAPKEA
ncbi:MAG: long-chain-fatty-acid--CoA ligase [Chloroflexi bacterium]|nr:long-chain-fatty-acid--CoA ligase [Chloroflexota bacterium]